MNKIRILPDNVSNKIAAGEVVERPASVVKELLENSIDAESSEIKIAVENAGLRAILVSDNGLGMSYDDALLSIEPHATSKITSAEDLSRIITFGFRGEALPSIISVSRFRMRTKTEGASGGVEIFVEGGSVSRCEPIGCAKGTEISVRDLLFNVPARKKFLRSDGTEENHITETVYSLALANPSVSFELIFDARRIFNSPGSGSLVSRIRSFFGKSYVENLLPVEFNKSGINISGFVAKHGNTRSSRKEQRIFINDRPADSPVIYSGIKNGYGSIVPHGRFPPVMLFIKTDPARVDVNVHPAKKEVRFREAPLFVAAVEKAIRETLRNSQNSTVHISPEISLRNILDASTISYDQAKKEEERRGKSLPDIFQDAEFQKDSGEGAKEHQGKEMDSEAEKQAVDFPVFDIIGSLNDTYILASSPDGLVIIDQHAAHERIMFEKITGDVKNNRAVSQDLLIPITIELSGAELEFIQKNREEFLKTGFQIEKFGGNTALIHAIPASLPQENTASFIIEMVENLLLEAKGGKINYNAIAREACSSAVKAHDKLQTLEIRNLLRLLAKCEMPFCCPHGRPTMINISRGELEKRFGRSSKSK